MFLLRRGCFSYEGRDVVVDANGADIEMKIILVSFPIKEEEDGRIYEAAKSPSGHNVMCKIWWEIANLARQMISQFASDTLNHMLRHMYVSIGAKTK